MTKSKQYCTPYVGGKATAKDGECTKCGRIVETDDQECRANQKHTPGPWKVDDQGGIFIEGAQGQYIAEVDSEGGRNESFANAALIAAAPDLLNCVKGFVKKWCKQVKNDRPINGADAVDWISGAMLEFHLSLAKAEGR